MRRYRFLCGLFGASLAIVQQTSFAEDAVPETQAPAVAAIDGAEIFAREWLPNDPRSHGGDGLGPMFNDSSCVACHNLGGAGGAGPVAKNVDIITAVNNRQAFQQRVVPSVPGVTLPGQPAVPPSLPQQVFRAVFGDVPVVPQPPKPETNDQPQAATPFTPVPGSLPPGAVLTAQAPNVVFIQPQFTGLPPGVPQPQGAIQQDGPQQVTIGQPAAAIGNAEQRAEFIRQQRERDRKALINLHPGFGFSPSVVLHKSATVTGFEQLRGRLNGTHVRGSFVPSGTILSFDPASGGGGGGANIAPNANRVGQANLLMHTLRNQIQLDRARAAQPSRSFQHGNFAVTQSQRNTTALFGAGLIDAVPVALLEDLEKIQSDRTKFDPKISGRVARLKDGSAGRFGWKAQTASLGEFVLTACAVEVGLNVPEHPQAGVPHKPDYKAPGLDLNQDECNALIQYISDLPAPVRQVPANSKAAKWVEEGHALFASVGCSSCHVEEIGEVAGIFSDLLLHDMGPLLGDTGSYGVFVPSGSPEPVPLEDLVQNQGQRSARQKIVGATRLEWRTPPLWGVRDSGPYMHDGRAGTLEQAIALHGGESEHITQKYFALAPADRLKLVSFLKTLSAPMATSTPSRQVAQAR